MGTYLVRNRRYGIMVRVAILNIAITLVSVLGIVLTTEVQIAMAIEDTETALIQLSQEVSVWLFDGLHVDGNIGGQTTGQVEYRLEYA
jgi:hypothetical protein